MEKFDHSYLEMAQIWAQNSYCKRRKVGALLVKDRMIISDGYNGTPSGFENICEEDGVTKPYVLHAEANAITKVAKSGNSSEGATLYVTASPCLECSKLIIQSGIKRVVYRDEYRLTDGIDLLRRAGIEPRRHRGGKSGLRPIWTINNNAGSASRRSSWACCSAWSSRSRSSGTGRRTAS